jgi:aryl-alcohol dehydrogenase-like predicted oxidoreductase
MRRKCFGNTGLEVSVLGVGLSEIGYKLKMRQKNTAARILNTALDEGINILDTAACYGISEELVGLTVSHRRQEYILTTKCGHSMTGTSSEDWMPQTIEDSINRSLKRLKTDIVDIVMLHSCSLEILKRGESLQALQDAQIAGKARFIGYSGDNEAAEWAVASGLFNVLETSYNFVDQRARKQLFPLAKANGMGIIIKRPIANAVWGKTQSPSDYANEYFKRAQLLMQSGPITGADENPIAFALGFVLAHEDLHTCILGTRDPSHMISNLEWLRTARRTPEKVLQELYSRFDECGKDWDQQI